MTSFQLSVTPHRRAAARFIDDVHRELLKAFADSPDITQTEIANVLGVHRSVINRQMRGRNDMSLGRVAEVGYLLGYEPVFQLVKPTMPDGCNIPTENVEPSAVNPTQVFLDLRNFTISAAPKLSQYKLELVDQ